MQMISTSDIATALRIKVFESFLSYDSLSVNGENDDTSGTLSKKRKWDEFR